MPEISRFFGIVIGIFYDDHNPPHFHARYERYKAKISINELKVIEGQVPPRVFGIIAEWAAIHKEELIRDWELAKKHQPLLPIEPLK